MIQAIIVDDEPRAQQELSYLLERHTPEVVVIDIVSSVDEAEKSIKKWRPQLVFLDIEMPRENGFNLLERFKDYPFSVIFTTAYDEYAIRAIRFSALDYLLKPIQPNELKESIGRAKKTENRTLPLNHLAQFENDVQQDFIILHGTNGYVKKKFDEIIRLEADRNYSTVFLENGERIVAAKTLLFFDELLANNGFLRCHRSHLVNLKHFKKLDTSDHWSIILSDLSRIPVAHRKKSAVRKMLVG